MKKISDLKIKIFADGADKTSMLKLNSIDYIKGLTTNPTLMKKAGIKDFKSKLETENIELAWVLYSFLDSITTSIYTYEHLRDEVCALSKICCHLLYKSLEKQIEINEMEDS